MKKHLLVVLTAVLLVSGVYALKNVSHQTEGNFDYKETAIKIQPGG